MDGDLEWIVAVARGDREALGSIYDRYAPLMLALGMRILRTRGEAEDVLHNVFVEVWRHAGDFDPSRGSLRAWLLLRMRSRCFDRRKSPSFARVTSLDAATLRKQSAGSSSEATPDAHRVRQALYALSADQRNVLFLGYFEGYSCSEIANKLGVPLGTVKSRAASGLARLRRVLNHREGSYHGGAEALAARESAQVASAATPEQSATGKYR